MKKHNSQRAPLTMWQYYCRAWTFPAVKRASRTELRNVRIAMGRVGLVTGFLFGSTMGLCHTLVGEYGREPLKEFVHSSLCCSGLFSLLFIFLQALILYPHLRIRRYHDVGRSGWNILWFMTAPFLLYFFIPAVEDATHKKGDPFANKYGPPPSV